MLRTIENLRAVVLECLEDAWAHGLPRPQIKGGSTKESEIEDYVAVALAFVDGVPLVHGWGEIKHGPDPMAVGALCLASIEAPTARFSTAPDVPEGVLRIDLDARELTDDELVGLGLAGVVASVLLALASYDARERTLERALRLVKVGEKAVEVVEPLIVALKEVMVAYDDDEGDFVEQHQVRAIEASAIELRNRLSVFLATFSQPRAFWKMSREEREIHIIRRSRERLFGVIEENSWIARLVDDGQGGNLRARTDRVYQHRKQAYAVPKS